MKETPPPRSYLVSPSCNFKNCFKKERWDTIGAEPLRKNANHVKSKLETGGGGATSCHVKTLLVIYEPCGVDVGLCSADSRFKPNLET